MQAPGRTEERSRTQIAARSQGRICGLLRQFPRGDEHVYDSAQDRGPATDYARASVRCPRHDHARRGDHAVDLHHIRILRHVHAQLLAQALGRRRGRAPVHKYAPTSTLWSCTGICRRSRPRPCTYLEQVQELDRLRMHIRHQRLTLGLGRGPCL